MIPMSTFFNLKAASFSFSIIFFKSNFCVIPSTDIENNVRGINERKNPVLMFIVTISATKKWEPLPEGKNKVLLLWLLEMWQKRKRIP